MRNLQGTFKSRREKRIEREEGGREWERGGTERDGGRGSSFSKVPLDTKLLRNFQKSKSERGGERGERRGIGRGRNIGGSFKYSTRFFVSKCYSVKSSFKPLPKLSRLFVFSQLLEKSTTGCATFKITILRNLGNFVIFSSNGSITSITLFGCTPLCILISCSILLLIRADFLVSVEFHHSVQLSSHHPKTNHKQRQR